MIHLYDPELRELTYSDGRTESVPDDLLQDIQDDDQCAEVVRLWAQSSARISDNDQVAMIAA